MWARARGVSEAVVAVTRAVTAATATAAARAVFVGLKLAGSAAKVMVASWAVAVMAVGVVVRWGAETVAAAT